MFDRLSEKFIDVFKSLQGKGRITESNIEEALGNIRKALLEADVNIKVIKDLIASVKDKALGTKVLRGINPGDQFVKILRNELALIMGEKHREINFDKGPLTLILIVGPNGQGKTSFAAKLAHFLKEKKKKSPLLIPADTFRPKAKEQLETLARPIKIDVFNSDLKTHPKDIALNGLAFAKEKGLDVAIVDTAGRLHVDDELMGQVSDLKKSLASFDPNVLLVVDAMMGQEASNMAQSFHHAVGLTGVVLSKTDSDAKGGAALSITHVTGIPIAYMSTGEKIKDLELFHPERLAGRILDMGDIVSLVEKAEEAIDEREASRMFEKAEKGKFSVEDLIKQMDMISKMGSITSLFKMIPGASGIAKQMGDIKGLEREIKRIKTVVSSMTKQEKKNYSIIGKSRIRRIAKGSGISESLIEGFLSKFRSMEKMLGPMAQMVKSGGGFPNMSNPLFSGGREQKKKHTRGPWGKGFFQR